MDRRDFIRQTLITALAAGPLRGASKALATDHKYPFDLPDELWYGTYDNFDGAGCYQPDTGEHLARAGEISDDIWTSYRYPSEIAHMDDFDGRKQGADVLLKGCHVHHCTIMRWRVRRSPLHHYAWRVDVQNGAMVNVAPSMQVAAGVGRVRGRSIPGGNRCRM